jgi:hypothetical protein
MVEPPVQSASPTSCIVLEMVFVAIEILRPSNVVPSIVGRRDGP